MVLALAVPATAKIVTLNNVAVNDVPVSQYVVKSGDNLWELAELRFSDPEEWRWLVSQNAFLQEPGRQFTRSDGTFVVLIRPGETIRGLEEVGITPSSVSTVNPQRAGETVVVAKSFKEKLSDWLGDKWGWLLLLFGVGLLFWFLRELGKDPVRSGPPQVTGGVNDQTVRDQFERRGSSRGFTLIPGSIVRGRGHGRMMVSYHGGTERPRNLNGETVYRARARFEDGREEDIYMLQGCGNDVRYGGAAYRLLDNFRFVEDETVAEPSPEPVMEEAAAPQTATAEPSADFDGEIASGTIHGTIQGPRTPGDKAMLRIQGAQLNGLTFTLSDRDLTVRWLPDDVE